jgi:hypothetical protein
VRDDGETPKDVVIKAAIVVAATHNSYYMAKLHNSITAETTRKSGTVTTLGKKQSPWPSKSYYSTKEDNT